MASLSEDRGKRGKTYRVSFTNAERQRKAVRLGAMPRKKAETVRAHIDQLEACLFDGSAPPPQTAAWLAGVGDTLRGRMEAVGLIEREERRVIPTLGELCELFTTSASIELRRPTRKTCSTTCERRNGRGVRVTQSQRRCTSRRSLTDCSCSP
jgi:hypothetical protein